MYKKSYPNLFKPIKIRNLIMKNRIMSAPNMLFHTIDGRPNMFYISYLEHKARGGAGIVTLGEANVCDGGNHTPEMETKFENMALYAEMAQAIHEHGAIASVELTHGGARAKPEYNNDVSKIVGPCDMDNHVTGAHVRAMNEEDMEFVANGFAETAEYYFHAGFDAVLVHCAHSWLLTQFLSPIYNKRTDNYGGSLENRMRFPLFVLKKIRERVGTDKAVFIRVSGSERNPDGFTPEDIAEFLSKAQEYVDMAEVSTEEFGHIFTTPYMQWGQNVQFAETIKKSGKVNIPVFTVGSIMYPSQAEEIIASGKADGVSMSRALIADPFLPKKAAAGKEGDIVPCLRCLNCTGSDNARRHFVCSVNPLVAREARLGFGDIPIAQVKNAQRVLIVGGGPAGMQAAITACERGHKVTLVEKSDSLGGYLRFAETDSLKNDLKRFLEYLNFKAIHCGAEILLNASISDELILKISPDHIIVATGSEPVVPQIKGINKAHHVSDVYLNDQIQPKENVVIIGGGFGGVEAGLHISNLGKKVTVLELTDEAVGDAMMLVKLGLMAAAERLELKMLTGARTLEVTDREIIYEKNGEEQTLPADTVLYSVGMRPREQDYFDLHDKAPFVTLVGDAKIPGKIDGAIHGGYFAAMDI